MNIWIFNHYAVGPGSSGGTRHFDLGRQLVKKGYKVTIFASSFDHQTRMEKHLSNTKMKSKEETYDGVKFIWVKTNSYKKNDWRRVINMFFYTFRSYFLAKNNIEKPDIIIGSLMHPFAALLGYIVAKKKKSKFYFEERDLWPQSLIDFGKVSKRNPIVWFLSKLELFLYRKADRIIILFDKAVNYVVQKGIERNKIIYLPNGVELERFTKNNLNLPPEVESEFNKLSNKFVAIYTGAHGFANYLDTLIDIAKLLSDNRDIHFVFIGDGPEKERLISRKIKENISNISFLKPVPKEYIPTLLKKADVGLIAMKNAKIYKWGFSLNKMYDYMAAGLPIVLLLDVNDNTIEQNSLGLKANDPYSMKLAIEKLYDNKNQLNQYRFNAKNYVKDNHSWDILSNRLIEIIEKDFA